MTVTFLMESDTHKSHTLILFSYHLPLPFVPPPSLSLHLLIAFPFEKNLSSYFLLSMFYFVLSLYCGFSCERKRESPCHPYGVQCMPPPRGRRSRPHPVQKPPTPLQASGGVWAPPSPTLAAWCTLCGRGEEWPNQQMPASSALGLSSALGGRCYSQKPQLSKDKTNT